MSLRHRLKRLEQVQRDNVTITLLCVDEEGHVLDDGSDQMQLWIDCHFSDVPGMRQ